MKISRRNPFLFAAVLVVASCLAPARGFAQVPDLIGYQGYLAGAGGAPVDGTVEMTFALYDAADATTSLWDETHPSVTVSSGVYSVILGSVDPAGNPLDPAGFSQPLWLGVKVGADDEMTPRRQLTSAPYAAGSHTVDGQHASEFAASSHFHAGSDISSGTVAEPQIDGAIARDAEVEAHASRTDNPHAVTAAQAGASSSGHDHDADYVNAAGDVMTGNLTAPVLVSNAAAGTPPIQVASNTLVSSLNADLLDGQEASQIINAASDEVRTGISSCPFPISVSGSYYITGDLTSSGTCITVTADSVTIDLMGYSLGGGGSGTNYGIYMNGRSNVEIRNGTVRGFGSHGIYEQDGTNGRGHRVVNVRVVGNGGFGIAIYGQGHLVKDCTVSENTGGHGIYPGDGSAVTGNMSQGNSGSGISAGYGCTVTGNTVYNNNTGNNSSDGGIKAYSGCLVKGNVVRGNNLKNIYLFSSDNAAEENLVTGSTGYGIYFESTGNFYANNRASGNASGDYGNTAGNTDGGGNVSF